MYMPFENERQLYRAIGFLDGVAACAENCTVRTAIYDAIEQLEMALAEKSEEKND